jgi:hypothetical protein
MPSTNPNECPVVFVAHPSERGRSRSNVPVCAGACSCCCCCCLHTIGGLIGAAVNSGPKSPIRRTNYSPEDPEDFRSFAEVFSRAESEEKPRTGRSAARTFWMILVVLVSLGLFIGLVAGLADNSGLWGLLVAGAILLMGAPVLQIVAIVVTWFMLCYGTSDRTQLRGELRVLGRISIGSIVGALAGFLAMVLLWVVLKR